MSCSDTEYPGYSVSTCGDVMGPTGKVLKPQYYTPGYQSVNINQRHIKVHRLVATAFIPNPENKPTVNHKDHNPSNNCIENLEWATRQEQVIDRLAYGKSGYKNIDQVPSGSWRVKIKRHRVLVFNKTYLTLEEAVIGRDNFLITL